MAPFTLLLVLVAFVSAETFRYTNAVTTAQSVRIASQLKAGMWEERASQQLATNGLNSALAAGSRTGWNRYYGLSDGNSLVLDYSARSLATNGYWGGNGMLQSAWIESNSVAVVRIKLMTAP